ncbi:two-component system, NarL family, sensor histidine kinase DesK [Lentzea xinjiangensis]|uniref:Two-component system, NarL family, sensor histidine kinase DesK n=1 Tax=Lentzea xinjiangensis TaxID=402600 RepID=A0A1H9L8A9_9PSEU|nr:two-component system, NarL family, sensor histidine kinase DesK [Lentzea xinjiangensis]
MLGWWSSRGNAARFDLFVRGTFYVTYLFLPPLLLLGMAGEIGTAAVLVLTTAVLVHTLLSVRLVHLGIEHYLGRVPYPRLWLAIFLVVTCVVLAAGELAYPHPAPGKPDSPADGIAVLLLVLTITALSTVLRPLPLTLATAAGSTFLFLTAPPGHAMAMSLMLAFVALAFRTTLWMLSLVWELDRSREVRASLAVAEERLRFARDLHDVVGRNLSVVALKAELAAQLARRGRTSSAVDEMLEVRRLAQDSMDELRAVVSGYRTADLSVELAGARSLLASAGIDCRVIGDVTFDGEPAGALGWAVREGVTNVLRHSEARTCTIMLRGKKLTMSNDGASTTGFRFGSGLTGLRERVSALGGSVTAASEAPNRFVLTVELP